VHANLTVIDVESGQPHDVVLHADPGSTVGDIAAALRSAIRASDPASALAPVVPLSRQRTPPRPAVAETAVPRFWLGSRALDPELTLRESQLRDGCIVTLGAPGVGERAEPTGVAELRVAGGPAAGGVHRLGLGERTVGLAPIGGVAIADPALADEHLRVVVGTAGVSVAPMPGRVVLREGQPVPEQGIRWQPGELLEAGNTMLGLDIPTRPDATLRASDDGELIFDRPPRRQSDARVPHLEVPLNRGSGKKADNEYAAAMARFTTDLWMAAHYDALVRRRECPDPAELLLNALGPRQQLWERRWRDLDALKLRVGVRSLPSQIDLVGPGAAQTQTPPAWSVPVTVPLRELGVLGVAGPAGPRRALARWLLVQAAVLHSPRDLSIVVFGGDGWEWVRWLPHLRPRHGEDAAVLVGNDAETAARRTAELTALIAARSEGSDGDPTPVLVVVDSGQPVRQLAGMRAVLERGPAAGVFAICLDEEEHLLPEECRGIVGFSREDPARVQVASTGAEGHRDVLADQVSATYSHHVARALAPLREEDDAQSRETPAGERLLEHLDLDPPTAEQIVAGWRSAAPNTAALVGRCPDGDFVIDIGQAGPHCLLVGAPGAGKSELLLTWIAALAVAGQPAGFTFVLVDDGASVGFADCAELPHCAGRLTDVDGHAAARAVAALTAEVRRRERLMAGAQAADIDDYLAGAGSDGRGLSRLMIVIDELAPLARELPALVAGLLDLARRGQNLGIHLVVATTHPDEPVIADVAAISDLRMALRMSDESQSHVIIGDPVAGRIRASTPGRGYARLGTGSLVPFQVARVAGWAPGRGATLGVTLAPWATAGQPPPRLPEAPANSGGDTLSDLAELVGAVKDAADELELPPTPALWLPSLPDVVTVDELAAAKEAGDGATALPGRVPPAPFAVADRPAERRRETVYFDVERDGHLMVIGAAQSGRSTLLRTIAAGLAAGASVEDVKLYVVDCGTDALQSLASLPHCSSMVTEEDSDELEQLLGLLVEEVKQRRQLLAGEGYPDIAEQRSKAAPHARLPYLVVVLDAWEDFHAEYEGTDAAQIIATAHELLNAGPAVGLRFILSADRSALSGDLSKVAADRILLRLDDSADYRMAGADRSQLPTVVPPGRGVRTRDGAEVQVALLDAAPRGSAQADAVERLGRALSAPPPPPAEQEPEQAEPTPAESAEGKSAAAAAEPALPEPMPERISVTQAEALDRAKPGPAAALVGVSGDKLRPRYLNLVEDGPGLLIAGPPGSGRSTTLTTMLGSLLAGGRQAVVLSPRPSPLRDYAGATGVTAVFDGLAAAEDLLVAWAGTTSPKVLVVDDLQLFGPGSQINQALSQLLVAAVDTGDGIIAAGSVKDLASIEAGFGVDIRQSRSGVLLTPATGVGCQLFGLPTEHHTDEATAVGRALLVRAGKAETVQVAIAE